MKNSLTDFKRSMNNTKNEIEFTHEGIGKVKGRASGIAGVICLTIIIISFLALSYVLIFS